tara:strand:+ start:1287 stop:1730 length:444 start_codon:yes stop_codon:yes gene_type:complete
MDDNQFKSLMVVLTSIDASLAYLTKAAKSGPQSQTNAPTASQSTTHTGWRAFKVPQWAKFDAGTPLGDISAKSLRWWIDTYEPKPWYSKKEGVEKPPASADLALRKALDQAKQELDGGEQVPNEPDPAPKPRPEPDAASIEDDDIPF